MSSIPFDTGGQDESRDGSRRHIRTTIEPYTRGAKSCGRRIIAVARESWTIESSSSRRQQPNSERRTRSSTHTVNLPLLPAGTANNAYGPKNRPPETSLGPESSFSLNLYVQSLRPAHLVYSTGNGFQSQLPRVFLSDKSRTLISSRNTQPS